MRKKIGLGGTGLFQRSSQSSTRILDVVHVLCEFEMNGIVDSLSKLGIDGSYHICCLVLLV